MVDLKLLPSCSRHTRILMDTALTYSTCIHSTAHSNNITCCSDICSNIDSQTWSILICRMISVICCKFQFHLHHQTNKAVPGHCPTTPLLWSKNLLKMESSTIKLESPHHYGCCQPSLSPHEIIGSLKTYFYSNTCIDLNL